jgi:DNA-directed RNA polymerase specialized sigma24 family protein/transcriptional regulator with XRE-family HTH domain
VDAKAAAIAYQEGRIDSATLATSILPLIARFARATANRMGRGVEADDLAQEVWLLLEKSILGKYDPSYPLEPFLLEYTRRVGMSLRRSWNETLLLDQDTQDLRKAANGASNEHTAFEGDEDFLASSAFFHRDGSTEIDETEIDKSIALERIRQLLYTEKQMKSTEKNPMLMPGVTLRGVSTADKPKLPNPERRQPRAKKLLPDHQELNDIHNELGWRQQEFADELGIGVPRLVSYLYGKTNTVPADIMEKARALYQQEKEAAATARGKFDGRKMADILVEWAEKLDLPYDDNAALAAVTGATVPTVTRWKKENSRPSIQGLLRYEHRVLEEVEKRKKKAS